MNKEISQFNEPAYANFVHPVYCEELLSLGLDFNTGYVWKIKGCEATLYSYVFDYEKVYEQILSNELFADQTVKRIPAFDISHMMRAVEYWELDSNSIIGAYQLKVWKRFQAKRFPDVFALAIIDGVKNMEIEISTFLNRLSCPEA